MNGFQVGVSYTPDINDVSNENALNDDDDDDELGSVYEAAVRYEGQFNNIGVIAGAGYTHADLEEQIGAQAGGDAFSDDLTAWNAGLDLDIGPFGVGVAYTSNDFGDDPVSANGSSVPVGQGIHVLTVPACLPGLQIASAPRT